MTSYEEAPPPEDKDQAWKPDPLGSGNLRWWDGEKWTNKTHAQPGKKKGFPASAKWALGALAVAVVIAAIAGSGDEDEPSPEPAAATSEASEPVEEPPVAAQPNGEYRLNCDYLLGNFEEGSANGYRFVAGGLLKNTGNVGTVVEAKAKWQILGSAPVVETKRVRLKPGQKQNVQMMVLATGDQIDAHQSANSRCSTNANIVNVFGKPE